MDYRTLFGKTVVELRALARQEQVRLPAGVSKSRIIELLLENDRQKKLNAAREAETQAAQGENQAQDTGPDFSPQKEEAESSAQAAQEGGKIPEPSDEKPAAQCDLQPNECPPEKGPDAPQTAKEGDEQPAQQAGRGAWVPTQERMGMRSPMKSPAQPHRAPVLSRAGASAPRKAYVRRNARPEENGAEQSAGKPRYYNPEYGTSNQAVSEMLAAGECSDAEGVLEIHPEGYGFVRARNYQPGPMDSYLSNAQIRRFNLRTGDYLVGKTRPQREGDRYSAMMYITSVNGERPDRTVGRKAFENLTPIYPDERLRLESEGGDSPLALRALDVVAPIGKGQRGLIVSPPKAGKTTLLKMLANAIEKNHPEAHLIVLLIDERPEEVTDMKRSTGGEVVYSTFDEEPENHTRVAEMVSERAQRLAEQGRDVVILLDSVTRLARAYNMVIPPTGRSLSGGMDPGALAKPKKFFGAARNIENGGSLTIIATALVETGSRMDDVIYEEFKGTGNMELHLDRRLSEKRIFPAIDLLRSGTRHEELLLSAEESEGVYAMRRLLSTANQQDSAEQLVGMLVKSPDNRSFLQRIRGCVSVWEKEGYSVGR